MFKFFIPRLTDEQKAYREKQDKEIRKSEELRQRKYLEKLNRINKVGRSKSK